MSKTGKTDFVVGCTDLNLFTTTVVTCHCCNFIPDWFLNLYTSLKHDLRSVPLV